MTSLSRGGPTLARRSRALIARECSEVKQQGRRKMGGVVRRGMNGGGVTPAVVRTGGSSVAAGGRRVEGLAEM